MCEGGRGDVSIDIHSVFLRDKGVCGCVGVWVCGCMCLCVCVCVCVYIYMCTHRSRDCKRMKSTNVLPMCCQCVANVLLMCRYVRTDRRIANE